MSTQLRARLVVKFGHRGDVDYGVSDTPHEIGGLLWDVGGVYGAYAPLTIKRGRLLLTESGFAQCHPFITNVREMHNDSHNREWSPRPSDVCVFGRPGENEPAMRATIRGLWEKLFAAGQPVEPQFGGEFHSVASALLEHVIVHKGDMKALGGADRLSAASATKTMCLQCGAVGPMLDLAAGSADMPMCHSCGMRLLRAVRAKFTASAIIDAGATEIWSAETLEVGTTDEAPCTDCGLTHPAVYPTVVRNRSAMRRHICRRRKADARREAHAQRRERQRPDNAPVGNPGTVPAESAGVGSQGDIGE